MALPPGRNPISNDWYKRLTESYNRDIETMQESRRFMENTCPASRHAQIIAESLHQTGEYSMLQEDPKHCAGTIASVVTSLYQARSFLKSLGYDWQVLDNGKIEWVPEDSNEDYCADTCNDIDSRNGMSRPGDKDYEV